MKIKKLNARGFSHEVLAIAFVLVFAVAGVAYLVASHAATPKMILDIAQPECGVLNSIKHYSYGIVGVNNDDKPNAGIWSNNPCLKAEKKHFSSYALYLVPNYPSGGCIKNSIGDPYKCGRAAAHAAFDYAKSQQAHASSWWVDTETQAGWNGSTTENAHMLDGIWQGLVDRHVATVGFYSTPSQWTAITAGKTGNGSPTWIAEGNDAGIPVSQARARANTITQQYCGQKITGAANRWVQIEGGVSGLASKNIDVNFACL